MVTSCLPCRRIAGRFGRGGLAARIAGRVGKSQGSVGGSGAGAAVGLSSAFAPLAFQRLRPGRAAGFALRSGGRRAGAAPAPAGRMDGAEVGGKAAATKINAPQKAFIGFKRPQIGYTNSAGVGARRGCTRAGLNPSRLGRRVSMNSVPQIGPALKAPGLNQRLRRTRRRPLAPRRPPARNRPRPGAPRLPRRPRRGARVVRLRRQPALRLPGHPAGAVHHRGLRHRLR